MTERDLNLREWENLENWSHPVYGLYFSKRDTRIWVPKRVPSFGWTLNLAHPASFWWMVGFMVIPATFTALVCRKATQRKRERD